MTKTAAVCVLASGSAGNCTALRRPDGGVTLIDAGLSPRMTRQRLAEIGLEWRQVTEFLLTHADSDHFHTGWPKALVHRPDIAVHAPAPHAAAITAIGLTRRNLRPVAVHSDCAGGLFDPAASVSLDAGDARGVHLPHDAAGTIGWRISTPVGDLGIATDLGRVPPTLIRLMTGVDTLLLESNYDPPMEEASPRPLFLKRRIMGGHGHLSNAEALDAACRIDAASPLRHLVLLHLSRQCNCPRLVRNLYTRDAPHIVDRLTIAEQHQPTRWLAVGGRVGVVRV